VRIGAQRYRSRLDPAAPALHKEAAVDPEGEQKQEGTPHSADAKLGVATTSEPRGLGAPSAAALKRARTRWPAPGSDSARVGALLVPLGRAPGGSSRCPLGLRGFAGLGRLPGLHRGELDVRAECRTWISTLVRREPSTSKVRCTSRPVTRTRDPLEYEAAAMCASPRHAVQRKHPSVTFPDSPRAAKEHDRARLQRRLLGVHGGFLIKRPELDDR
jgi:hypothetical protein